MARPKVAVLRTRPETVLEDYSRLCELAGMKEALDPSATTILKDNISWHLLYPSANTTPWQLEGTILALRDAGLGDLVDVHNKTVVTIADLGDRYNKFGPVLEKYGIPKKYNFEPQDMTWVRYQPKAKMAVLDKVFPDGIYLPDYFYGKNIVHLPTVKTHSYTVTTGAMKNAFGGLLNVHRHYTHTWIHDTLVDLLAIQKEIHTGLFATMDGTTAGSGPGPRTLVPHQKDVILASADQVAIDAVSALMMGFEPMDIHYIAHATERGLGQGESARDRSGGHARDGRRALGIQGGGQPGHRHGHAALAHAAQGVPEAVLSHAAGQHLYLCQRDVPRPVLVPHLGASGSRAMEAGESLGTAV